MKSFTLQTHGYYLDKDRRWMPSLSGLFFVYKGRLDEENRRAILAELVYIGEASNIKEALADHPRRNVFLESCRTDEVLFYSYAEYLGNEFERKAICSAVISVILPAFNGKSDLNMAEESINISVEGPHAYIPSSMNVGTVKL